MFGLTDKGNNKLQSLLNESGGCAVLDTGCSNTVCGKSWLEDYLKLLPPVELSRVEEMPSSKSFTFGDGNRVTAFKQVKIPVHIGNMPASITTDVDCNIPCTK